MAIGAALYERLVYAEDGGFVTGSLFDCALPTANAVGKDFLPGGRVVAPAPSGSGFQVSLYGLIGILFAAREGLEVNLLGLSLGVDPGQAGTLAAGPPSGSGCRAYRERQPPLTSIAAPGSAARSPSRWRATRRHASRCIRARRREPRSGAAGR